MLLSVVVCLSTLLFFKYGDFFLKNLGGLLRADIGLLKLALPIGVSFYTFQILSYTIDLYRGNVRARKNFFDFAAYVTMFPQLIAGPIVRYSDVDSALTNREHSIRKTAVGIRRFIIGLGKKVLIANLMGELVGIYKISGENSVLFTWLYLIAFTLQIYFDFSGYSDMAIGLGHMLGFSFLENFNYPYIAKSITDFWRRWHISLSSWFKDYVYIPLGGSRVPALRHVFNIAFIWFLTGFWHGADWNFIIWGLYYAALLLIEKFVLSRFLDKLPGFLSHIYVMLLVVIGWALFDASDISAITRAIGRLFGAGADGVAGTASVYYLRSYLVPIMIGIAASTPIPGIIVKKLSAKKCFIILEPLALGVLLIVITAHLADGSFNPFIYFRF
jgi:alginate O-acetyltransferase complex protein AlgI